MDVTAFEADEWEGATWNEVVELIPKGMQPPVSSVHNYLGFPAVQSRWTTIDQPSLTLALQVRHGARICKHFGAAVLLIVAGLSCVVAFVLMVVWISLYWLLTQLLFKTAALLRVVYDEPMITECHHDSATISPGPREQKPEIGSDKL